ncbi:MAG: AraC family transcriptional regulator [Verrucomicrobiota bacterium]|jgi:AraC-like DNA-binding protein
MNFAAIKLHSIGHLLPDPRWQMNAHAHSRHELVVVLAGQLHVEIQGQTLAGNAGDVFWYPNRVAHREWTELKAPVESLFLQVEWPELRSPSRLMVTDIAGRLSQLARWLFAEREADSAFRQGAGLVFAQAIVAEYLRLTAQRADPWVADLRKFMRLRLRESLTLDDLAEKSHLSKFHFVRRYQRLTGHTPMKDLRLIRLEAARDLLLTTNLALKEIAPRVGLGDAYRLCRLFRQHFQTTTGALRHR